MSLMRNRSVVSTADDPKEKEMRRVKEVALVPSTSNLLSVGIFIVSVKQSHHMIFWRETTRRKYAQNPGTMTNKTLIKEKTV